MAKYKVTEEFELDGVKQEVGTEIELTDEQVTLAEGKVEAIAEATADTTPEGGEATA